MKLTRWLIVTLLFAGTLSSCGILNQASPQTSQESPSTVQESPYPGEGAEPITPVTPTFVGGIPYPELSDGDNIPWPQAVGMIMGGMVTKVVQTHDLKVMVTLADGRTFETLEPAIDEVMRTIQACGDLCKNVMVATE